MKDALRELIIEFVSSFGLGHEVVIFILSMAPITELRASVPLGLTLFEMPVATTWVIAVLGNMTPTLVLLALLPLLHDWVLEQPFIGPVFKKKLHDAEKYFSGKYTKYGSIALILFVGIPLPFTGAWTGSLAAFIFKIPFRLAAPLIFLGVCLAATIMTVLTVGIDGLVGLF